MSVLYVSLATHSFPVVQKESSVNMEYNKNYNLISADTCSLKCSFKINPIKIRMIPNLRSYNFFSNIKICKNKCDEDVCICDLMFHQNVKMSAFASILFAMPVPY